ncbi:MAG: hypothetical protein ACLGSD_06480 [Acidobacteriota bacterium]
MNRISTIRPPRDRRKPGEDGYVLLAVLIMLVLFVIAMTVAAPRIAASIQRDREVETMERGKQYIRAIQLYYRKFNAYPPNVEALVKTNDIRFLRKRYKDPITGKDDWKPIYFGQNKQPIAYGFFGQPLDGTGGAVIAGTGPSGGNGYPGATTPGGGLFSGSQGPGTSSPTGGLMGGAAGPGTPGPGQTGDQGSTGASGSTGTTDANGTPLNGQQFGGGGIIGFEPASPKKSILTYKKKNKYNEWEFTYSPMMDQQMMQGGNAGAAGGLPGAPGVGPGSGPGIGPTGGPGVGPGSGPGGGAGSTPIAPPGMPTQPQ